MISRTCHSTHSLSISAGLLTEIPSLGQWGNKMGRWGGGEVGSQGDGEESASLE